MFNRKAYKEIALKQLKGRWTTPVLAALITSFILGILNLPNSISYIKNIGDTLSIFTSSSGFSIQTSSYAGEGNTILTFIALLIEGVLSMAFINLFVVYSHTTEKQSLDTYFKGFSLWLQGFLGELWMLLWVFLWSLLFVIPGIIKAISYSQMFFILAEHPDIGVVKAMNLSKKMTKGYCGDLFVMYLSFIGWGILSLLTCGILGFWLRPYMTMSFTNAYHALKEQSFKAEILKPEDFN